MSIEKRWGQTLRSSFESRFIGEERNVHDRASHQNPSVLFNLTSSREQRLLLTLMQIGTHFIAFTLQWIGKGGRRERRSAFTTQIDIYQSQRTASNCGYSM